LFFQRWCPNKKSVARLKRGLQTFLPENHTSYCTAVRGPDILRNVIVSK